MSESNSISYQRIYYDPSGSAFVFSIPMLQERLKLAYEAKNKLPREMRHLMNGVRYSRDNKTRSQYEYSLRQMLLSEEFDYDTTTMNNVVEILELHSGYGIMIGVETPKQDIKQATLGSLESFQLGSTKKPAVRTKQISLHDMIDAGLAMSILTMKNIEDEEIEQTTDTIYGKLCGIARAKYNLR
jgi:hypothetical protein